MRKLTCFAILIIGVCVSVYGQDSTVINKVTDLPASYYDNLTKKYDGLEGQLTSKTKKYLKKIEREESKMYKKLWKKDSVKAKALFGNVSGRYNNLENAATAKASALDKSFRVYSGKLDSMETAIHFLEKNGIIKPGINSAMNNTIGGIKSLKDKLNQADQIKKYLEERKKILTEELSKIGLLKNLGKFNKQLYYYKQQLQEYKNLLDNPSAATEKLIGVLSKVPAFRNFFNKHSIFASLFRMPSRMGRKMSI